MAGVESDLYASHFLLAFDIVVDSVLIVCYHKSIFYVDGGTLTSRILSAPPEECIMKKTFIEMKLFQVKPDKLEQFEAKIEEMTANQFKCEGCICKNC